mmetsp:Transcript_28814/g.80476  ORF Transcript_28814/g.80476 Transcript_28814/m.80476 type:complete len:265 (+) Transcript_28814:320-1114(+)
MGPWWCGIRPPGTRWGSFSWAAESSAHGPCAATASSLAVIAVVAAFGMWPPTRRASSGSPSMCTAWRSWQAMTRSLGGSRLGRSSGAAQARSASCAGTARTSALSGCPSRGSGSSPRPGTRGPSSGAPAPRCARWSSRGRPSASPYWAMSWRRSARAPGWPSTAPACGRRCLRRSGRGTSQASWPSPRGAWPLGTPTGSSSWTLGGGRSTGTRAGQRRPMPSQSLRATSSLSAAAAASASLTSPGERACAGSRGPPCAPSRRWG